MKMIATTIILPLIFALLYTDGQSILMTAITFFAAQFVILLALSMTKPTRGKNENIKSGD